MLKPKEITMSRIIFIHVFLITLLVTGCGKSAAPQPLPESGGEWTIHMTHSGGIMGLSRLIEISSDGKFTVMDERAEKKITGELSVDELSKINEQVMSFKYIRANKPDGGGCADCFIYDLEIQRNGEEYAVQLNDISLPNSGLAPLVSYLRNLSETALK
jgi:hypothetical protein